MLIRLTGLISILVVLSVTGQTISLTGTVVDSQTSAALSGATVKLMEYPQVVSKTDVNGTFTLRGTAIVDFNKPENSHTHSVIKLSGNYLDINSGSDRMVKVAVFGSNGICLNNIRTQLSSQGEGHFGPLWNTPGFRYVKLEIDGKSYSFFTSGITNTIFSLSNNRYESLAKKAAATYTLQVFAPNHVSKKISISNLTGDVGTIRLAADTQKTGVWTNVTPDGILVADEYGVQDILTDPARPSDLYAFTCLNGVWKSTDYGITWAKISKKDGPLDHGRAWGETIDKNPNRNPSTPPRMYACQGYGSERGAWVSTDGGVNWTRYQTGGSSEDVYNFDTDPNDCMHVICGMHGDNHCYESTDGGVTWKDKGTITGDGRASDVSPYVWFITSDIWLAVSQSGSGSAGTFRTKNRGASWSSVLLAEHAHGANQIFIDNKGATIYLPHDKGISKSSDYGATWTTVSTSQASVIVGTANYLYCGYGFPAIGYTFNPNLLRTSKSNGTTWTSYTTAAGMTNGPKRGAVTFDGTHYVIVFGNWCGSGIWRYVEP